MCNSKLIYSPKIQKYVKVKTNQKLLEVLNRLCNPANKSFKKFNNSN